MTKKDPSQLTKIEVAILKRLMDGHCSRFTLKHCYGIDDDTLTGLVEAGYLNRRPAWYAITLAGREALAHWANAQIPPLPPGSPSYGGRA